MLFAKSSPIRLSFVISSLLVLFTACATPGPPPVPPLVDELAPVVADVHLSEAMTNEVPVLLRDSIRQRFYDNVLNDHGLDRETFDSLLWIIRAEPYWVDSLYSQVGNILAKRGVAAEAVKAAEK